MASTTFYAAGAALSLDRPARKKGGDAKKRLLGNLQSWPYNAAVVAIFPSRTVHASPASSLSASAPSAT